MNPKVKNVTVQDNYLLLLQFSNGEYRCFDMKPYLEWGMFKELKDYAMFSTAHSDGWSVEWANELALCPDTMYEDSVFISKELINNK